MTRLDCLHLVEATTPVQENTWGRIKSLYVVK